MHEPNIVVVTMSTFLSAVQKNAPDKKNINNKFRFDAKPNFRSYLGPAREKGGYKV